MNLEAGYRFCEAPRFHVGADWAARLRVGGLSAPGQAWRELTAAELSALVAAPGEAPPEPVLWQKHIALFVLPAHVLALWWELAGRQPEGEAPDIGPLARAVAELAQFKRLPLPPRCTFELSLTGPGAQAAGTDMPGDAVAGINLGDGPTAVVLSSPLVRMALAPGEGVWLPPGITWAHHRLDEEGLGVWLTIRRAPT